LQPFSQPANVIKKTPCIFIRKRDNRVVVEAYATTNTVVVGGQQSVEELVAGGKPFHTGTFRCSDIADFVWVGDHHEIVFEDMEALSVEHETALALRADEVDTTSAQLFGVDSVKVFRKYELIFHAAKIRIFTQKVKN
jgi:hypothetical protein